MGRYYEVATPETDESLRGHTHGTHAAREEEAASEGWEKARMRNFSNGGSQRQIHRRKRIMAMTTAAEEREGKRAETRICHVHWVQRRGEIRVIWDGLKVEVGCCSLLGRERSGCLTGLSRRRKAKPYP